MWRDWRPTRLRSWTNPLHVLHGNTWKPSPIARHDDSSLYPIFEPHDIGSTVRQVEGCVALVQEWMKLKSLKF